MVKKKVDGACTLVVPAPVIRAKIFLTPVVREDGYYSLAIIFEDDSAEEVIEVRCSLNRDQVAVYLKEVFGARFWTGMLRRALEGSSLSEKHKNILREILAAAHTSPARVPEKKKK